MSEPALKGSMEEFSISSAVRTHDYGYDEQLTYPGSCLSGMSPNELFTLKHDCKTPETAVTIDNYAEIPILWRGYTSDEEVASPVDNDDFSFDSPYSSDHESVVSFGDGPYHAQTCNGAQQVCSRAQAVQVVSAGKAKVITMPKATGTTESPRGDNTAPFSDTHFSSSTKSQTDLKSIEHRSNSALSSLSGSSVEHSRFPPTPSPRFERPVRRKIVRRKPKFPKTQTLPQSESAESASKSYSVRTAIPARAGGFLNYDPFPSRNQYHPPASPSPSLRRMRKLSSSFSLRGLARTTRRAWSPNDSIHEGVSHEKDRDLPAKPSLISDMHVPLRTSSKPMPRMVPRGANERAAPIVLPPCPDDYDAEPFTVPPPLTEINLNSVAMPCRRRSFSAVSTQA